VTIKTSKADMPLVKHEMYEVVLKLSDALQKLKTSSHTTEMKKELLDSDARVSKDILSLIEPESFIMALKGETKEDIITELVDCLAAKGKLLSRDKVLADVFEREGSMSTGMKHGIALPHCKTDGIDTIAVAVGIKKAGIDFASVDGVPSRLFFLVVSPKKTSGPHIQFLAAIGTVLRDGILREAVINATSSQEAVDLLRKQKNG